MELDKQAFEAHARTVTVDGREITRSVLRNAEQAVIALHRRENRPVPQQPALGRLALQMITEAHDHRTRR